MIHLLEQISLTLVEVVQIEFILEEQNSGIPVENARLIAVSQDGLGNISLSPSNESGYVSDTIMPGVWSLTLEKNGIDRIWSVDNNEETTFDTADAVDNLTGSVYNKR